MSSLYNNVLRANLYIQPVQFILGILTNSLTIWIFCSRALRSSACTQYFLAYAVLNTIYMLIGCPAQFLRSLGIDWASNVITCKIFFYLMLFQPPAARLMLAFAAFDRYRSSSSSRPLQSISKVKRARIVIVISTILMLICMSPTLIIYYWNETSQTCITYTDPVSNLFMYSQMLFFYLITPMVILIFGGLTVYNIRIRKHKIHVQTNRRTEGQLARMLLAQITTHIILSLPFGVVYCMNSIDSSTRTLNILAIRYLFLIWYQCDFFISFFLYVLTGKVYREEFLKIFKC